MEKENLKIGDMLTANTRCEMKSTFNHKERIYALIVGKKYPVKSIQNDKIIIESEIDKNHFFNVADLELYFV